MADAAPSSSAAGADAAPPDAETAQASPTAALFAAALCGDQQRVADLLAAGTPVDAPHLPDEPEEGAVSPRASSGINRGEAGMPSPSSMARTALHAAAAGGHAELVDFLIAAGASPAAPGSMGLTALHLAAMGGHFDVALALTTGPQGAALASAADELGRTPSQLAAKGQVKNLLESMAVSPSSPPSLSSSAVEAGAEAEVEPDISDDDLSEASVGGEGGEEDDEEEEEGLQGPSSSAPPAQAEALVEALVGGEGGEEDEDDLLLATMLGESIVTGLRSSAWKERDQAIRSAADTLTGVSGPPQDELIHSALVVFMRGIKDKVAQVVGGALALLRSLCSNGALVGAVATSSLLPLILDELLRHASASAARPASEASQLLLLVATESPVGIGPVADRALTLPADLKPGAWKPQLTRLTLLQALVPPPGASLPQDRLRALVQPALSSANAKLRQAAAAYAPAPAPAPAPASALPPRGPAESVPAESTTAEAGGGEEGELPFSEPVSDDQLQAAAAVVEHFGPDVARCLYASQWAPRVAALKKMRGVVSSSSSSSSSSTPTEEGSTQEEGSAAGRLVACRFALGLVVGDRVIHVFSAALELLEAVVASFASFSSSSSSSSSPSPLGGALRELVGEIGPQIVPRLGDSRPRTRAATAAALQALAETPSIGAQDVAGVLLASISKGLSTNAKETGALVCARLELLASLQRQYRFLQPATMAEGVVGAVQAAMDHRDKKARTAALDLFATAVETAPAVALPCLMQLGAESRKKVKTHLIALGDIEEDFDEEAAAPHAAAAPAATNATSSGLPYAPALTEEQKEGSAKLIEVFGEQAISCLLSREWPPREAVLVDIEHKLRGGVGADGSSLPLANPEVLLMTAELLELSLPDTVTQVYTTALKLLHTLAATYLPTVPGAAFLSRAALQPALCAACHKLGDLKARIRGDSEQALLSLCELSVVGPQMVVSSMLEVEETVIKAQSTPITSRLDLLSKLVRAYGWEVPVRDAIDILLCPAFESRHAEVRSAAVEAYCAIHEQGSCAEHDVDLPAVLSSLKPALQSVINERLLASAVHVPNESAASLIESAASKPGYQVPAVAQRQLSTVFGADIAAAVTAGLWQQREAALCNIAEQMVGPNVSPSTSSSSPSSLSPPALSRQMSGGGAPSGREATPALWEVSCLAAKQGLLDAAPQVKVAAIDILKILSDPRYTAHRLSEPLVFPWGDWEARLVLGSLVKTMVDALGDTSVRVRQAMSELLLTLSTDSIALGLVVRHLLSPVDVPQTPPTAAETDVGGTKKRIGYQRQARILGARLHLLNKLVEDNEIASDAALNLNALTSFLAVCARHRSQLVGKLTSEAIVGLCAASGRSSVQQCLQHGDPSVAEALWGVCCSVVPGFGRPSSPPVVRAGAGGVATGSSHVHRISALRPGGANGSQRPPWSVPASEAKTLNGSPMRQPPSSAGRNKGSSRRQAQQEALSSATERPLIPPTSWLDSNDPDRTASGQSAAAAPSGPSAPSGAAGAAGAQQGGKPDWLTSGWAPEGGAPSAGGGAPTGGHGKGAGRRVPTDPATAAASSQMRPVGTGARGASALRSS